MATEAIHPNWTSSPLVKRAIEKSPDCSAASIFSTLLDIMHEVEDRFPGVPYAELLSEPALRPDMRRTRTTLRRCGATEADIALVCPTAESLAGRRKAILESDPYDGGTERL